MSKLNVFGKPLAFDVGVTYDGTLAKPPSKPVAEGDDLSIVTLETATKRVVDDTGGTGEAGQSTANAYPIKSTEVVMTKITSADGTTPPLSPAKDGFATSTEDQRRLSSYSNSAVADNAPRGMPVPNLSKGKSSKDKPNGNTYLPSKKPVEEYSTPLLRTNRFNDNAKIPDTDKKYRVNPGKPLETLGSYQNYLNSTNGKMLSDGDMANIGPMLSLRSTKELSSDSYGQDGPDGVGASGASILPGLSQVALEKVAMEDLTAQSVLAALIKDNTDAVDMSGNGKRKVLKLDSSYGQLNNVLEPFNGLLPLGMITTAAALAVALNVALRAILALFLLVTTASNSNSKIKDKFGRYILGQSQFVDGFDKNSFPPIPIPAKLFGLRETKNPYGSAVDEGIKQFFGGSLDKNAKRILESPGFYANFSRTVVQSAADLGRAFKDIGTGNPVQVAENIIGLVDIIKSSKVVGVLNVFAQLGDSALVLQQEINRNQDIQDGVSGAISTIDSLDDEPGALKNRKKDSLKLAWGNSQIPSAMLFGPNYSKAAKASTVKPKDVNSAVATPLSVYTSPSAKLKITLDDVTKLEEQLNAEYVPFYFHDLRTSEIVSMPAFLTSLSDAFDADYTSDEAYGRVEPIKSYKRTSRKISLGFMCVPTSPDDFDEMWLKINKLTTFVYPQWSQGTVLAKDGESFIQPFSQIPSATPVIRIRIGDLIRSNYSDMNLARTFGLGTDDFKLNDASDIFGIDQSVLDTFQSIKTKLENLRKNTLSPNDEYDIVPGSYETTTAGGALDAALGAVKSIASTVGVDTGNQTKIVARVPFKLPIVIEEDLGEQIKFKFKDGNSSVGFDDNLVFVCSKSHLVPNQQSILVAIDKSGIALTTQDNSSVFADEAVRKFFDATSNSIVKSFKQNAGKGLACVVETLSFEWVDNQQITWETDRPGYIAPKLIKVTMAISPIHDLAPGIDSDGVNRAPIYPVGGLSNALGGHALGQGYISESRKKRVKRII